MTVSANVLLALGASPAMVHAAEEVEDFVAISDCLAINIGTLSPPWVAAMRATVARANTLGKPWVLDPVGCGATAYRTQVAAELAGLKPSVIRGNASEIMSLAGQVGAAGKGVELDRARRRCDVCGGGFGAARRLRCGRHRRDRLCERRRKPARRSFRTCPDAAVDRARLFAQCGYRRLHRRPPAAAGGSRRACRIWRGRGYRSGALPRTRSPAGGNLRRAARNGPRHARRPRATVGVSRAAYANQLHPRAARRPANRASG